MWNTLKRLWGSAGLQYLAVKQEAFGSYKPTKGTKISTITLYLNILQHDIWSINPAEKPSDTMKIAMLFKAIGSMDTRFEPMIL